MSYSGKYSSFNVFGKTVRLSKMTFESTCYTLLPVITLSAGVKPTKLISLSLQFWRKAVVYTIKLGE